jgi:catechol 2,3-dioxygenase-like lactoylglutathione lyase family enzyme
MAPTFNGIGLAVADMAAALAFYRDLGLELPAELDKEPHAEAVLPGGIRLMFDTHESLRTFDPDFRPPTGEGASLAFLCADPAEVDAVHDAMVAAGHRSVQQPWDAAWGQRYALLADPDGNQIDLFAWVTKPA